MKKVLSIVACLFLGELATAVHLHAEEAAGTEPNADHPLVSTTVVNPPPKPHVDPFPHPHPSFQTEERELEAEEQKPHGGNVEAKGHVKLPQLHKDPVPHHGPSKEAEEKKKLEKEKEEE